jgi:hypothetical protein
MQVSTRTGRPLLQGRKPLPPLPVKPKPQRRPRQRQIPGSRRSPQEMVSSGNGSPKGISNVLGQRTDIPLTQTFAGSESLGRFNGSAAFTATQFAINPGQAVSFPWLSKEAILWEKYEFDKLEFEFRTTINEFSANALGRVILGFDFDASDPPPANRSQAEISRPVTAQAPYFNQRLAIRKSDMNDVCKKHYVRPGNLPGAADIKMYDVGVLNFSTDGNVNGNEVGELWVHYSGTFHVQVLESLTTPPANFSVSQFASTAAEALATTVQLTCLLATTVSNGLNAVNTAGSVVLPLGNYLVSATAVGSFNTDVQTATLVIQKNGAAIVGGSFIQTYGGAADLAITQVIPPSFVTSNGTDAFTLKEQATFAAGTGTISGSLVFVAA